MSEITDFGLGEQPFGFRVGESVLTEFVRSHDFPAVFTELVQNEYDAGGKKLFVHFGENSLTIKGNGVPIDRKGWNRLCVVMGTGRVGGSSEEVEAKRNGIGSKNFGLKTLFLFGDAILIQSAGKKAAQHIRQGTMLAPIPDTETANSRGVTITVPYRLEASGKLNAFTPDSEQQVMDSLAQSFASTLLKLSEPNRRNSLEEVIVSSDRLNRKITWKQVAKHNSTAKKGFKLLTRRVSMTDTAQEKKILIEEYEWQSLVEIPQTFGGIDIPGYFQDRRNRIKIGVSLRTSRGKLRPEYGTGIVYYPLGVAHARTGNAVSINAPFEMDDNRSQIIAPGLSLRNKWLLETAAEMTIKLLPTDWFERFGASAYAAIGQLDDSAMQVYSDAILSHLNSSECWPSRDKLSGRGKKQTFEKATNLNFAERVELDHFLDKGQYLHDALSSHKGAREVAKASGVKSFTLDSLVRIRCAGNDTEQLETKVGEGESNYYFTRFPDAWLEINSQIQCVNALNANSRRLSNQNRNDLKLAPTTLAATGALAQAQGLYRVPIELSKTCPVPLSQQLHPDLTHSKVLGKPWTSKALMKWVQEVCERAELGEASAQEREAIYMYVLSIDGRLPPAAKKAVINAPILLDSLNEWVEPKNITLRNVAGARIFGHALHFPHRDYAKNTALARALGFRVRISGDDVVRFAELIPDNNQLTEHFEIALQKYTALLTKRIIKQLTAIPFLRCSDGVLRAPSEVYLNTAKLQACVGPKGPYPAGESKKVYQLLGCQIEASLEAMTDFLLELREDIRPPKSDLFYPELILALKREGEELNSLQNDEILWIGSKFAKPLDTLVASQNAKYFDQVLPCVSGFKLSVLESYLKLGAHSEPTNYHWEKLLTWIGSSYEEDRRPLKFESRKAVRQAYIGLSEAPTFPAQLPWLLDETGILHRLGKVKSNSFLIDDDVQLSEAIRQNKNSIVFADVRERATKLFFMDLGVRFLTQVRRKLEDTIGEECKPPRWFNEEKNLERISRTAFGQALTKLVAHEFRRDPTLLEGLNDISKKLRSIGGIQFVENIRRRYRISDATISVLVPAAWKNDVIFLTLVHSNASLVDNLAYCISDELFTDLDHQVRFSDALYRLLSCRSARDIRHYMEKKGIGWKSEPDEDFGIESDDEGDINDLVTNILTESISAQKKAKGGSEQPSDQHDVDLEEIETETETEEFEPLPPIDDVEPDVVEPTTDWTPPETRGTGGGSGGGTSSPPTETHRNRDEEIGRRGEEIVYNLEKERVRRLGLSTEKVVWVAKNRPTANHDIQSIDKDGSKLFLEVKSTSGTGGRFFWSKAEFQLALTERGSYILCRVYNAGTQTPKIRQFRDPIALLKNGALELDFESLKGEIEPL
jgi:hypothetical protein